MFEKAVRIFYNIISVTVHVCVLSLLLSIPVLFAVYANSPLEFSVEKPTVNRVSADDELFKSVSQSEEGWYRIDYRMTVSAKGLSPYGYTIDSFTVTSPSEWKHSDDCILLLEDEIYFGTGGSGNGVLVCYLKSDADPETVSEYAESFSFATDKIIRHFSFFKYELQFDVPGFSVSEALI